jgi:hypothetical protein
MLKNPDPAIWGPPFWFFLHTVAYYYPDVNVVNQTAKRKYYDFIMNLPLFIPDPDMARFFSQMLDDYPVTPYLDCRDSFTRWVNYMHNRMNRMLGKEELSIVESLKRYESHYMPPEVYVHKVLNIKRQWVIGAFIALLCFAIFLCH